MLKRLPSDAVLLLLVVASLALVLVATLGLHELVLPSADVQPVSLVSSTR